MRATLVLVPLFGLHLIVTIYRPAHGACVWMQIYYYGDYLLDGLQGAMVALIFCYLNGEVRHARIYQKREVKLLISNPKRRGERS